MSEVYVPTTGALPVGATVWLKARKWELDRYLPEPGHGWVERDTGLDDRGLLRSARKRGVIHVVGSERLDPRSGRRYHVYETDPRAYAQLEYLIETADPILPCGHDCFENPRDVDGIRCTVSYCRAVVDPSEVRR